ncbi:MAG: ABC transporter substrate-binding protein [Okeania sp. SIO2C9]|uniref:ABC transporter substrate-binding protein n=1 Tax=Okeania sp. SIO2C9 TaxID=2607791 RepID=UPI0013C12359|nr:ABC transporter substrate-binding protein [Okeania sp. SIO2C9]NEQ72099.1 ABC transporter substrate-binding protein [Okeania sp. SIO2C9]
MSPKKKLIIWLLTVLLTVMAVIVTTKFQEQNQENITIAIAAPLSNAGAVTERVGKSMVRGAQLYIEQVNKAGGIQGKQLQLQIYDDQGKIDIAEKVAREIVQSPAIAVIGHYSSSASLAAGKIYQATGIPAISGSATADAVTADNEWYFRTIFNDSFQGKFIATYLRKVLGYSEISIIRGYDAYGLNLGKTIETAFRELGGEIVAQWQLPTNQSKVTDRIIIQELEELKEDERLPEAIVFATNRDQVTNLLREIKNRNLNLFLFGGDDIGDVGIAQSFTDLPEEKETPGFFTNGLFAIVPIIYDVANDRTQEFRKTFEKVYEIPPGWSAASYYDATTAVVEAIHRTLLTEKDLAKSAFTGKDIKKDRSRVRKALLRFDSPDTAVETGTRRFYFDRNNTVAVPPSVGIFDHGQIVSAFTQLQIIPNIEAILNSDAKIASGNILQMGQQYLEKTDIVYVGLDINKVNYLDEKSSTYVVDFYLWFRYKGNLNPDQIEFSNYGIERLDSGERLTIGEPIQSGEENGVKYKIYRIKADFHEEFDFHSYPFDKQRLSVRFRHTELTRDRLIYAIDLIGMQNITRKELFNQWKQKVFKEITSWTPTKITFFQNTLVNDSTLGYRQLIDTKSNLEYSQFNAVIEMKRKLLSFSIKNLLPLWFFVVVAYQLLFLPFDLLSAELFSGLLLAIVFYHLSLLESLPDGIGYVVALDYAFYLLYFLCGLELTLVTVGSRDKFKNNKAQRKQLILLGRVLFPVILLVGSIWLYLLYL